jgi:hypothetical protein
MAGATSPPPSVSAAFPAVPAPRAARESVTQLTLVKGQQRRRPERNLESPPTWRVTRLDQLNKRISVSYKNRAEKRQLGHPVLFSSTEAPRANLGPPAPILDPGSTAPVTPPLCATSLQKDDSSAQPWKPARAEDFPFPTYRRTSSSESSPHDGRTVAAMGRPPAYLFVVR